MRVYSLHSTVSCTSQRFTFDLDLKYLCTSLLLNTLRSFAAGVVSREFSWLLDKCGPTRVLVLTSLFLVSRSMLAAM
jgi:hypothetical protein